jgi:hypothetical protein
LPMRESLVIVAGNRRGRRSDASRLGTVRAPRPLGTLSVGSGTIMPGPISPTRSVHSRRLGRSCRTARSHCPQAIRVPATHTSRLSDYPAAGEV